MWCGPAGRVLAQVVAIHRDVERAERHLGALDLGDPLGDPAGEVDAAGGDAEEDESLGALVALEDLVGDAGEGPGDVTGVENGAALGNGWSLGGGCVGGWVRGHHQIRTSFSASQDGSLKDVDRGRQYQPRTKGQEDPHRESCCPLATNGQWKRTTLCMPMKACGMPVLSSATKHNSTYVPLCNR